MEASLNIRKVIKHKWFFHGLRIGFAIVAGAILNQFPLYYFESYLYDMRVRARPAHEVSGQIQTVAIDRPTIKELARTPSLRDHVQFLDQIHKDRPKAVIYLVSPMRLEGVREDREEFARVAMSFEHFYVQTQDPVAKGQEKELLMPPPLEHLSVVVGPRTRDSGRLANDGVTRRVVLTYWGGEKTLHFQLAQLVHPEADSKKYRGVFDFNDSDQLLIDYRPAKSYPQTSFLDVIKGNFPQGTFTDRFVFLGIDSETDADDYIQTPYSREVIGMSLLEMHANMLDTILLDSSPVSPPDWVNFVLTSLVVLVITYAVLALKPAIGLATLTLVVVTFCLLSYALFSLFGVILVMIHPLLASFLCYYLLIPYRLIMENRRSWEYFQKNKLLTQVEELKTNFISMMSHDLKTPLARIQGMTEIILGDPKTLSDRQRDAIMTIRQSGQELTRFISSILDLGRVESKEIKLHLTSKDINALLSEIIKKFEYLASTKEISIATNFEPLFSIRIDVELMGQVFSNLIENAIKYSPEKSHITVSTNERDGFVVVEVQDDGLGIPRDELNNIFLKFYRSKDVKTSKIKGSGLGLYLAKYFVELHQGTISVESGVKMGSSFIVELPTGL